MTRLASIQLNSEPAGIQHISCCLHLQAKGAAESKYEQVRLSAGFCNCDRAYWRRLHSGRLCPMVVIRVTKLLFYCHFFCTRRPR